MQRFIVLYKAPVSVLDSWMQTSKEVRDAEEQKMQLEWAQWMKDNKSVILETVSVGKPMIVAKDNVAESRNDLMMYCVVQADSLDSAKQLFVNHPHLQIPEATIEIMLANPINL